MNSTKYFTHSKSQPIISIGNSTLKLKTSYQRPKNCLQIRRTNSIQPKINRLSFPKLTANSIGSKSI